MQQPRGGAGHGCTRCGLARLRFDLPSESSRHFPTSICVALALDMVARFFLLATAFCAAGAFHGAPVITTHRRAANAAMMGGKNAKVGLFSPLVYGAKAALGEQELLQLRAKVISEHSKVIGKFVDTHESPFGQLALKTLFEAADTDGSGDLDKKEVEAALKALGFSVEEKTVDGIVGRADVDDNDVIDFEEFCKDAPKTLRMQLIKLAKQNGNDLGFLV